MLPIKEVEGAFYNLHATVKEDFRQMFIYSDSYWMNKVSLSEWNKYDSTSNSCEGTRQFINCTA